jgi:hypothetical protein
MMMEVTYVNGGKRKMFTCAACLQANRTEREQAEGLLSPGEGI